MAKFQVLDIPKLLKLRFGILSWRLIDPKYDCFKSYATYHVLLFLFFFFTSSTLFTIKHASQFTIAMKTAVMIFTPLQGLGLFCSLLFNMERVVDLHETLQDIVDEGDKVLKIEIRIGETDLWIFFIFSLDNGHEVHEIYWNCELEGQKQVGRISRFIHFNQTIYVLVLSFSIYKMCHGNFDTSDWLSTHNLVLPFDDTTVWGWFLRCFIQINDTFSYVSGMVPAASHFVCCCIYIGAICDHFNHIIRAPNMEEFKETKNQRENSEICLKLKENFVQAIQLHFKLFE